MYICRAKYKNPSVQKVFYINKEYVCKKFLLINGAELSDFLK